MSIDCEREKKNAKRKTTKKRQKHTNKSTHKLHIYYLSYYWWCASSFCRITFHYSNQLVWQTSTVNGNNRCFCLQIRNCCIYFPVFGRTARVFRSVFGYENMSNAIIRNTHNKKKSIKSIFEIANRSKFLFGTKFNEEKQRTKFHHSECASR